MYKTQQALIDHLQSANLSAKTIKRYAGEVQAGMRQRIDLPAILILFTRGSPIAPVPDYTFSLLYCAETTYHENEKSEKDALIFAQSYNRWLMKHESFEGEEGYYRLIELESSPIKTVLNDHKYTILDQQLRIRVDRPS